MSSLFGIKEWSTALADSSWLKTNSEESIPKLRLDALSIPHYVIKKGRCNGARHGELKNRKSTKKPGTRGRDAAKELTLKVNITRVFTIVFSETKSIVTHNSQLVGPSKSAWRWTSDASKRKEKQKWAIEKPKLDNARRLRRIFCFEAWWWRIQAENEKCS